MARAVVAGNWKMNTSVAEARALASELRESIGFMEDVERVLCRRSRTSRWYAKSWSGRPLRWARRT